MATKKRFVDVVSTKVEFNENEQKNKPTFEELLKKVSGTEFNYQDKVFDFNILKSNIPDCIIGLIITSQDRQIPPKRHKQNKKFSQLSIDTKIEALAFANVFIYDCKKNILIYEINGNGCFLRQFAKYLQKVGHKKYSELNFEISYPAILRKNEYERMLKLDFYKKLTVELFNPTEIINCFNEENDSFLNNIISQNIKAGIENNANTIKIEQISLARKYNKGGLSSSMIKGIIDVIKLNIIDKGHRQNIQNLKVEGYTYDGEDSKRLKPIDLLADTFNEYFKITAVQVQTDVQESERKMGIIELYNKLLPEILNIIGE